MNQFNLLAPASAAEAIQLLAAGDEELAVIAGGTGMLNMMKQNLAAPDTLVSLHRVSDLSDIVVENGGLTIGACLRLHDLERHPLIARHCPVLIETLREVASPRIRSMATIGGAIAHGDPSQDTPVTLLALDAVVRLRSAAGDREVPLQQFYLDYYETLRRDDELVTAIHLPALAPATRFAFHKFTPGSAEDYAVVTVCVRGEMAGGVCRNARIALGAIAPTVRRAPGAEALLEGQSITPELARQAGQQAATVTDPVSDTRGSADYKSRMTAVMVARTVLAMLD